MNRFKISSPKDMEQQFMPLENAILSIEDTLKTEMLGKSGYNVVIHDICSPEDIKEIEHLYTEAGWGLVSLERPNVMYNEVPRMILHLVRYPE